MPGPGETEQLGRALGRGMGRPIPGGEVPAAVAVVPVPGAACRGGGTAGAGMERYRGTGAGLPRPALYQHTHRFTTED